MFLLVRVVAAPIIILGLAEITLPVNTGDKKNIPPTNPIVAAIVNADLSKA